MKILQRMGQDYFTDEKCGQYYDDIFPILCQLFEVPYDGEIIPRDKPITYVSDESQSNRVSSVVGGVIEMRRTMSSKQRQQLDEREAAECWPTM